MPQLADRFNVESSVIQSTLDRQDILEVPHDRPRQRKHTRLEKKLRVLHSQDKSAKAAEIKTRFGISERTIGRIKKERHNIM